MTQTKNGKFETSRVLSLFLKNILIFGTNRSNETDKATARNEYRLAVFENQKGIMARKACSSASPEILEISRYEQQLFFKANPKRQATR